MVDQVIVDYVMVNRVMLCSIMLYVNYGMFDAVINNYVMVEFLSWSIISDHVMLLSICKKKPNTNKKKKKKEKRYVICNVKLRR